MAIKTDGTLWAWGTNNRGRLGIGDLTDRSSPVQVGTLNNWSKIYPGEDPTGNFGSCAAIKTDGTLWAWGMNSNGQNGQGERDIAARSSPVQIGTNTNFASGSFGQEHGIALLNDGTLASWGIESAVVLGQPPFTFNINRSSPTQVGDFNYWGSDTIISVGSQHTVARKSNGTLWAWGANTSGQLGHNDAIGRSSPVQVGTLNNWKLVSAGSIHTVLIKEYT
jgi:alpha-tubulin suppressor-like RCC1 family protein